MVLSTCRDRRLAGRRCHAASSTGSDRSAVTASPIEASLLQKLDGLLADLDLDYAQAEKLDVRYSTGRSTRQMCSVLPKATTYSA